MTFANIIIVLLIHVIALPIFEGERIAEAIS